MASETDQPSQQLEAKRQEHEQEQEQEQEQLEVRNERQVIMNLKQLKSLEILKEALTIVTSNTKFMFFMILSILPFFALMVFTEIKLQKAITYVPTLLTETSTIHFVSIYGDHSYNSDYDDDGSWLSRKQKKFLFNLGQLCFYYLVLYPLFEIFSMIITIRMTAKAHVGDKKQATLKEILNQNINNLKGLSITCLCVHVLSTLTLIGLIWIVANHCTLTRGFNIFSYFNAIEFCMYILSIAIHSLIFLALLYKYLDWSAFWNTGMVISILEEETGIGALGMADYYGKHCKKTGFQVMLVFLVFGNVLRLPCLLAGLCNESLSGVLVSGIGIGIFCLVNLVKWVAFVLYFYDCKHQTLEKKADEEVGKP